MKKPIFLCFIAWASFHPSWSQQSVAHQWVNDLLFCITNDFARPPIHARNLHHLSIVMHDGFAAYKPGTKTILLNNDWNGFQVPFYGVTIPDNVQHAQEVAISYAAFRLLSHRFQNAPGAAAIFPQINGRMGQLGLDPNFTSTDYITHGAAALGNYIAQQMIAYGFQDGSNEQGNYANLYYTNGNPVIEPELPGNPNMINPNRFQRISLTNAIDQAGNPILGTPPALAHEWGNVAPFSLKEEQSEILVRDGETYKLYFNPGHPPYIDTNIQTGIEDFFKWNFLMVSVWQSHLDTLDEVLWDVSPSNIGNVNISQYPNTWQDYLNFYNFYDGGDIGEGYSINPITNQPYEPQIVRRGDYARVLAEFWADGLDSETPPGHWFKIYNEISQHPLFERKWKGQGAVLSDLEYDVKAYLLLGGAMHDAAIAAWAVKGYYDYLRPISAIRFMGDRGQSSDPNLPNFHPAGLPLIPGYVELVNENDPLVGANNEHLNKIKLYTWRGHDYVIDPHTDMAGVGWILCENWWPYQRPTFVTPPFAGYVSGHSTYSRAAARAMHFLTGTPYFPGGMSNFVAEQNAFLEFEIGPSETVVLQWATYYDASDQCSLSRIWGGIHPPIDDIPGRKIGQEVGIQAAELADSIVTAMPPKVLSVSTSLDTINTFSIGQSLSISIEYNQFMNPAVHPQLVFHSNINLSNVLSPLSESWTSNSTFEFVYQVLDSPTNLGMLPFSVVLAQNIENLIQNPKLVKEELFIDTKKPMISNLNLNPSAINSQTSQLCLTLTVDEPCDTLVQPIFSWTGIPNANDLIVYNALGSSWNSAQTFDACFDINPQGFLDFANLNLSITSVVDLFENPISDTIFSNAAVWDTQLPEFQLEFSDVALNIFDIGSQAMTLTLTSTKAMNTSSLPNAIFTSNQMEVPTLSINSASSSWSNPNVCSLVISLGNAPVNFSEIDLQITNSFDLSGNPLMTTAFGNQFILDTKRPEIIEIVSAHAYINTTHVGNHTFYLDLLFDEAMDQMNFTPVVSIRDANNVVIPGISYNIFQSSWQNEFTFRARFNIVDMDLEIDDMFAHVSLGRDITGNPMLPVIVPIDASLDTKNPALVEASFSELNLNQNTSEITITSVFDEPMHEDYVPNYVAWLAGDSYDLFVPIAGSWTNSTTYEGTYQVSPFYHQGTINLKPINALDLALNAIKDTLLVNILDVDFIYLSTDNLTFSEVTVYPNPVQHGGILHIQWSDKQHLLSYEILDMQGRRLSFSNLESQLHPEIRLNPEISAGLYWLKLQLENQSQFIRIQIN